MAIRRDAITPDLWTVTDCGYDTPCWVWNRKGKNSHGHCAVWISGKEYSAHRTVYEQYVGPIPKGLVLDHLCENPPCVNPDHLHPTTSAENIRRSKLAKLNWQIVRQIRGSTLGAVEGAAHFGISKATWYSVRRGDTWK
jgi:hypothetical protein